MVRIRAAAGLILATALLTSLSAYLEPPSLTGTWNMGLQAQHVVPTPLVLTQDGKSLTGTIGLPTQNFGDRIEVKLTGEIADRTLNLSGTVEGSKDNTKIAIDGTILEDGTLEGHIDVPPHGKLPWTAERLKVRKPAPEAPDPSAWGWGPKQ
jgi:hypothetical protein